LARRVGTLEDARLRAMAERVAAEHGLDVPELLGPLRRMAAEELRLRVQGRSEAEIRRGLVLWTAADLDLDPDRLEIEWERDLRRRERCGRSERTRE
jgi:hypothetical protein